MFEQIKVTRGDGWAHYKPNMLNVRTWYFMAVNFALRIRYWFQGYTWEQTAFKVFAYRLQRALGQIDFHVFRTNREL